MSCIIGEDNLNAALAECKEPGSFNVDKFFNTSKMTKMSPAELQCIFQKIDDNGDTYLDKEDIKTFLQKLSPCARPLTNDEACDFVKNGDPDNDGKIGVKEFQDMVSKCAKK
ncbi:putative oncomodulin-2 [Hyperolius riggenbachi]|uniref:putative oncomodulin-2 n=1 Tax=Hyperolius riggenbachi TaxID=752182 RepID=UPI0035A269AA